MREMKDSGVEWIGAIPSDWIKTKCKYISRFYNGYAFDSRLLKVDYKFAVIRIGDIKGGTIDYLGCQGVDDNIGLEEYRIKKNDILLAMSGATVGKVGLSSTNSEAYINQRVGIIRTAFPAYLFYCLNTKAFIDYIILMANGSAQPNVSGSSYGEFIIPYPSFSIQKRIVSFLDSKCAEIDALTADIQEQIDTLEQYKRSVITETVTKGLNPDAEMKDSGIEWIGSIPAHWDVMPNKYIMHKEKDICPIYQGEDILSLTMNGVIVRDLDAGGKMPKTFDGYQKIRKGNLLMCLFDIDVTPRCIGIINSDGLTSPAYSQFVLHSNATANYYYYYYLMLDFTKELLHMAKNLRHSLTEEQLGTIQIPVPPVGEQIAIADYLDSKCAEIDGIITQKREQIATIEEYKKSLIFEYVTGKKEVNL